MIRPIFNTGQDVPKRVLGIIPVSKKQGKLSGSCGLTIYEPGLIQFADTILSDGYFLIFLSK